MYRRFHDRFGTAGVVIAVIALIAALGGTALAAGGLTSTQKKEVTKIAKKYAGKPGVPGAAGTNGTNGKDGALGAEGKEGKEGAEGKEGKEGAEGKEGKEGSPWTAGGTLPSKKTETGAWAIGKGTVSSPAHAPISFPIPLAEGLDGTGCQGVAEVAETCQVHYINPAGKEAFVNQLEEPKAVDPEDCGSGIGPEVNAENPQANPGHLCVYAAKAVGLAAFLPFPPIEKPGAGSVGVFVALGASTAGARLSFYFHTTSTLEAIGTWAVTAE